MVQTCCSCPSLQVQLTTLMAGTTNIATLTVPVVGVCYLAPIVFLHRRSAYPDAGCYFSLTESNSVPQEMTFAPQGMTSALLGMTFVPLEMLCSDVGGQFGGHGDDTPWRRDDGCRLVSDGTDTRLVRCGHTFHTMRTHVPYDARRPWPSRRRCLSPPTWAMSLRDFWAWLAR